MDNNEMVLTSKEKIKDAVKWLMSLLTFIILWIFFAVVFSVVFLIPYWIILGQPIGKEDFVMDGVSKIFFSVASILSTILAQSIVLKVKVDLLACKGINLKQLILGGAVGAGFMLSFALIQFALGYATYQFVGITGSIFTYILIYVLVAINEELLFRGFLIPYLSKKLNLFFVVLVSSILFGVAHIGNSHITLIGFFNITLSGVLFALIYLKFKNLSAPIAMHFTWNFFQGSVLGYPVSGHDGWSLAKVNYISKSEILSGGLFGAEGSVVLIPISLFAILIFFVRTKRIAHIQS